MALETNERFINDGLVGDKFKLIAASDVTLKPYERIVRSAQLTANISLTLASVSKMAGKFVSISVTDANSKTLTVQDADDSEDWTDLTVDADLDGVLLFSDGIKWWVVTNDIA